jgi:hypothetical protein
MGEIKMTNVVKKVARNIERGFKADLQKMKKTNCKYSYSNEHSYVPQKKGMMKCVHCGYKKKKY